MLHRDLRPTMRLAPCREPSVARLDWPAHAAPGMMNRRLAFVSHSRGPPMEFPQKHGPWQILARETVYRDPWLQVDRDQVIRPDGNPGTHCIVHLLRGISVLAVDGAGMAYVAEDVHEGVGGTTVEVVSGGIEDDESALQAAQRELREELGITAASWTDLGSCDPFTTIVVSPTQLFLARELTFGATDLEGSERTRTKKLPFDTVVAMVADGRITHAPSCLLILKTREILGR